MSKALHVKALLAAFHPRGLEDAEHVRRMVALCERGEEAFLRDTYDEGHFTASAFILSPDDAQLLLIHHAKLARWLQPGGHVEPTDRDVVAAARREAREEVGLEALELVQDGVFDVDIHAIPPHRESPAHLHFDVRFLFRSPTLAVRAASDAQAVCWVPLDEVDAVQSDASVMRAVRGLRARRGLRA